MFSSCCFIGVSLVCALLDVLFCLVSLRVLSVYFKCFLDNGYTLKYQ